jgi:hypothetical protein
VQRRQELIDVGGPALGDLDQVDPGGEHRAGPGQHDCAGRPAGQLAEDLGDPPAEQPTGASGPQTAAAG